MTKKTLREEVLKMQRIAGIITESEMLEAMRSGVYNNFEEWKKSFPEKTEFKQENNYMVAKSEEGEELGKWNPASKMGMHADDSQYKTL